MDVEGGVMEGVVDKCVAVEALKLGDAVTY